MSSNYKPLTKQERWALREVQTNPEIRVWRDLLDGPQKRKLNHPNAVVNRWKADKQTRELRKPRQPSPSPATKPPGEDAARWRAENAALKAEIAALKAAQRSAQAAPRNAPTRTAQLERPSELDKLKSENTRLRAREDPDAAKLRKKVVELQAGAHSMRVAMKRIAKERDRYHAVQLWLRRVNPEHLKRRAFTTIAKPLHPDSRQMCSEAEVNEACRLFLLLGPLFESR